MYFGLISLPSSITGALFRKFPHIQKLGKSLPDLQSPSDFFQNLRKDHNFMGKLSRMIETVLVFLKLKNSIFVNIFLGGGGSHLPAEREGARTNGKFEIFGTSRTQISCLRRPLPLATDHSSASQLCWETRRKLTCLEEINFGGGN